MTNRMAQSGFGDPCAGDEVIESVNAAIRRVLVVGIISGSDNFFLLDGGTEDVAAPAGILSTQYGVPLSALDIELVPKISGIAGILARAGNSQVDTAATGQL